MPNVAVRAELKNRIKTHQESLKVQAQLMQQILANTKGRVNVKVAERLLDLDPERDVEEFSRIQREINNIKSTYSKNLSLWLGQLDADLQSLASQNYVEFTGVFDAKSKNGYKQLLEREITSLGEILTRVKKKQLEQEDPYELFIAAIRIIDATDTVLGIIKKLPVRYR